MVQFILANTGGALGPASGSMPVTGGGADPYTGSAATAARPAAPQGPLVPLRGAVTFDSPPPAEGLAKKLREFAAGPASGTLTPEEVEGTLVPLVQRLCSGRQGPPVGAAESGVLERMLTWPPECLFPVFDLLRLLALSAEGAVFLASRAEAMLRSLDSALDASRAQAPALQTGLRLVANLFRQPALAQHALQHAISLLGLLGSACGRVGMGGDKGKQTRLALATVLLNYSAAWLAAGQPEQQVLDAKTQVVALLTELLQSCPSGDADTLVRAITAAGTACWGSRETKDLARDLSLVETVRGIVPGCPDSRVKQVSQGATKGRGWLHLPTRDGPPTVLQAGQEFLDVMRTEQQIQQEQPAPQMDDDDLYN